MTNANVIDNHELTFDPGDPLNGSLYLCQGQDHTSTGLDSVIAALRAAQLWSDDEPKRVPDEQRAAYKEQLQFVEAVTYSLPDGTLLIARFDHAKFPSDQSRWDSWKDAFDASYARI
jgi:hypothetical protein